MVEVGLADGITRTNVYVVMTKTEKLVKMAVVGMGSFCVPCVRVASHVAVVILVVVVQVLRLMVAIAPKQLSETVSSCS